MKSEKERENCCQNEGVDANHVEIAFGSPPLPSYPPYWLSSWPPLAPVLPHCGNHSDTGGSQVPSTVACEGDQSPPGIAELLPQVPDQERSRNLRFLG